MQLIYRAQVIEYTPAPTKPYCKPRALNWRFHAPNQTYADQELAVPIYRKPQALNWRFQLAAGI